MANGTKFILQNFVCAFFLEQPVPYIC